MTTDAGDGLSFFSAKQAEKDQQGLTHEECAANVGSSTLIASQSQGQARKGRAFDIAWVLRI